MRDPHGEVRQIDREAREAIVARYEPPIILRAAITPERVPNFPDQCLLFFKMIIELGSKDAAVPESNQLFMREHAGKELVGREMPVLFPRKVIHSIMVFDPVRRDRDEPSRSVRHAGHDGDRHQVRGINADHGVSPSATVFTSTPERRFEAAVAMSWSRSARRTS